jgi:hypothetical protein
VGLKELTGREGTGGVDYSDFFLKTLLLCRFIGSTTYPILVQPVSRLRAMLLSAAHSRFSFLVSYETEFLIVGRRSMVISLAAESGPHDLITGQLHKDARELSSSEEEGGGLPDVAKLKVQVGRCRMNPVDARVESAWFQRLKLKYE